MVPNQTATETTLAEKVRAAIQPDAPWGSLIELLDGINTLAELEEVVPVLAEGRGNQDLPEFYRRNLKRWPDPKLEDWFKKDFPMLSARLDTPQKVRVFLRGADFRRVSAATMGSVFEEIIRKHEVEGQMRVHYPIDRGTPWHVALRIVYHTQLQAWTLTKLALPGHSASGSGSNGTFIEWRS